MNRVIEKLSSGQWILTVSCAFVFTYMACTGALQTDAVVALIGPVFVLYFQRNRNGETKTTNNETQTTVSVVSDSTATV